ncbi:hypothetical protein BASA61_008411 [Batrachochytrium salamandrivorans]|nr:hypothetical protein BASA61_008411 [Batrachochytrium salamandrivorans]
MLSSLSESSVKETSSAFASSTSPDFRKEILDAFESTDMDSQVVETIAALCHTFALSPSDLFYKWDAFTANQTVSMDDLRLSSAANRNDVPAQLLGSECPTLEQLAQLRQILGRDQQKKLAKTLAGNNNSNNNSINNNTQMSFRHHSASQQQSQLLPSLNHKSLMALIQAGTPPNSSATTTSTSGSISQLASHPQKKIVPTQSSMANTNSRQPKTPNPKSRSSLAGRAGSLDILSSPPFGQSAFSPPVPLSGKLIGEERSLHDTIDGQSQSSSPSIKFSDRPDRAKVMDSFNKHIQFKSVPPSDPVQCELSLVPGQQTDGYRYMYEKLTEKGELLDAQIEYFSHIIANAYHLELTFSSSLNSDETKAIKDTPMEDPMSLVCSPVQPRNEPGLVIGRICCDSLQDGVGLNSQSVMLECSRDNGGGIRVKVDLNGVLDSSQQCTLFPGQIVGLIATNPSGRQLHASRIIYPTFPPRPTTNLSEIKSMYPAENGANQRAINVVVASGPFTLIGNLLYESLESLVVDVIEDDPPDVVILLGPFVDLDHPLIASGQVLEDVDDIFRNQIAKRIDRMRAARPGLQVILIPSIRDACSEWIAFPSATPCIRNFS